MNDKLKAMLTIHEGKRVRPYADSVGIKTIGCGHNMEAKPLPSDIQAFLDANNYITDEMIDRLLVSDVRDATTSCEALYDDFPNFSENRQNALIDFLFNIGLGSARKFIHANYYINHGEWENAADALLDSTWAKQVHSRATDITELIRSG